MRQCTECEFCQKDKQGRLRFKCNPFVNIKEPECVNKWMLLKLDVMVRSYQATLSFYKKLAPLQEKMFRHMERELDDIDEADQWKYKADDDDQDSDDDNQQSDDDNQQSDGDQDHWDAKL